MTRHFIEIPIPCPLREGQGKGGVATGRSLGTELVDLNTKRVTRIIGEGKPADALCALPSDGTSDTLLVGGPDGIVRQYEPQTGALRRQQQIGDGAIRDLAVAERSGSKTQFTGVTGAALIILMIVFVPGLFRNLPQPVLALRPAPQQ